MKIYLFIVFTFLSINIFANENMSTKMNGGHHHKKYMKKISEEEKLTPLQREQAMTLRVEYMDKERVLIGRSKEIRREMNHCMRDNDDKEKYRALKTERKELRKKMNRLRKDYRNSYESIIKKQ